jgi:hypothetical protein
VQPIEHSVAKYGVRVRILTSGVVGLYEPAKRRLALDHVRSFVEKELDEWFRYRSCGASSAA